MILDVLAAHGIAVRNRLQLGPTNIVRAAILAGQIDIYPEYTGNGALFFHMEKDPVWKSRARGYAEIAKLDREKNHLIWLAPAPADNTWVIAVRQDLARRDHLATMSDFARWVNGGGRIKLAASAEFVESPSALPAFEASYGFRLSDRQLLTLAGGNTSATLRAAAEGMSGVDAAMAYGTDGAIAALGLVALADDKGAQIVYAPAPVVRAAVLRQYPQIAGLLDPVFAGLTLATLQRLNAAIAVDGEDAGIGRRCLSEIAASTAVTSPADPATRRPALGLPIGVRNPVLLVLVIVAAAAAVAAGFVALAPNRLVSGRPIGLLSAAGAAPSIGIAALGALLLAAALLPPRKPVQAAAALLAALLLLSTLAAAGDAASTIAAAVGPAARVSLGAAFWTIAACASLAIVDQLQRLRAGPALRLLGRPRHRRGVRGAGADRDVRPAVDRPRIRDPAPPLRRGAGPAYRAGRGVARDRHWRSAFRSGSPRFGCRDCKARSSPCSIRCRRCRRSRCSGC